MALVMAGQRWDHSSTWDGSGMGVLCSAGTHAGLEPEFWHSDFTSAIYHRDVPLLSWGFSALGWISAAKGGTSSVS